MFGAVCWVLVGISAVLIVISAAMMRREVA